MRRWQDLCRFPRAETAAPTSGRVDLEGGNWNPSCPRAPCGSVDRPPVPNAGWALECSTLIGSTRRVRFRIPLPTDSLQIPITY